MARGKAGTSARREPSRRTAWIVLSLAAVVLLALALRAGLGGSAEPGSVYASSPEAGSQAPDFVAEDVFGNRVSLSDFRGRPVVLWFMAAWCPSCIYASKIISEATSGYEDVVVIMVDLWSRDFLKELGILDKPGYPPPDTRQDLINFYKAFDREEWIPILDDGSITRLYKVRYIDTVFVIDREGNIVLGGGNVVTEDSLKRALAEAGAG